MPSARQCRYYFGVLLEELMDKLDVKDCDRRDVRLLMHWMFKRHFKITSITDLPVAVMEEYLTHIRIECNVEFGIFLHEPNEGDVESMDMGEFLKYKTANMEEKIKLLRKITQTRLRYVESMDMGEFLKHKNG
jgi:hypothetical protein